MARRALTIFLLISVLTPAFTQESSNFTQFYMNPYRINPSYAGIEGRSGLFLTYRKQWVGIDGAPTISNLSFHSALKSNVNIGLNVNSDAVGILNTTALSFTLGYTLPLSSNQYIRFGISGGMAMNQLDFDPFTTPSAGITSGDVDQLLDQNLYPVGDVGFSYHNKYFNLGVSVPNMFERQVASFDNFSLGKISAMDEFIFYSSYRFYFIDDKFAFEPHGIYRMNKLLPSQFEGAGIIHINHTLWLGGSYKQNFGISALGGVKFNGMFALGYSYSLSNSGVNELNSPTHEVQLNLLFGEKRKHKHVYSFVDSKKPVKKKTKRELLAEKHKEEQARLAEERAEESKRKEEETLKEKEARERLAQAQTVRDQIAQKKKEEVLAQQQAEQQAQQQEQQQKAHQLSEQQKAQKLAEQQKAQKLEEQQKAQQLAEQQRLLKEKEALAVVKQPEPKEEPVPHQTEVDRSGNIKKEFTSDQRVVVKRGKHFLELPVGDYVVVGAFGVFENAEKYSDRLHEQGYPNKFGYISETKLWYVHIYESQDIELARSERDKYRKKNIFKNAWVLGVEH